VDEEHWLSLISTLMQAEKAIVQIVEIIRCCNRGDGRGRDSKGDTIIANVMPLCDASLIFVVEVGVSDA